jgi:cytochrome c biogenesis protein CcdA/thiol-disulfide isomerase/thioredoxin
MPLFLIAYLAGVITIATPCVFPILPFVLARADAPFRRGGLPMLVGLAFGFAAVASLASVAGGWVVAANQHGRTVALAVLALFGLSMVLPGPAARMARPLAALGGRLVAWAGTPATARDTTALSALLLGVATGLVWAPCAGPVLGLVLTGAALHGPSLETSLLLLSYGMGAASALAAGALAGGRVLTAMKRSIRWSDRARRLVGATVIAAAAMTWLGLDTGFSARWSPSAATSLEQALVAELRKEPALITQPAHAEPAPVSSAPLAALFRARQWLNTPLLGPEDLRGKVVLVNFWTYSCINCLRVLPHVRGWARTYGDRGLFVIGVHTPEFAFEKDAANVGKALAALSVNYPVAIDNDFGIWRAFDNQAWPALYFIGADGQVRRQVLGEGRYDESERLIQRLLSEARGESVAAPVLPVGGVGAQAEADAANLRSGETYIGYAQMGGFVSPTGLQQDVTALYRTLSPLPVDRWGLTGTWTIGKEFATSQAPQGRIGYRFHARDLHLVLAPAAPGQPIRYRVTLDGVPPGADHGADVEADGWGTVQDGRLYQMIRQTGPITDRTFEIEFLDAGVRAYAFTFG